MADTSGLGESAVSGLAGRVGGHRRRPVAVFLVVVLGALVSLLMLVNLIVDLFFVNVMREAEKQHEVTIDVILSTPVAVIFAVFCIVIPILFSWVAWRGFAGVEKFLSLLPIMAFAVFMGVIHNPAFNMSGDDEVWMGITEYLPGWQFTMVTVNAIGSLVCVVMMGFCLALPSARAFRRLPGSAAQPES